MSADVAIKEVEQRSLSLFRDGSAKEYRRLAIILVYNHIQENPDITESKLKHELRTIHNLPASAIDGALSALISPACFSNVKQWYYPNTKSVKRYKALPECSKFETWFNDVLAGRPDWKGFINNAVIRH